jgi:hypothetical protein
VFANWALGHDIVDTFPRALLRRTPDIWVPRLISAHLPCYFRRELAPGHAPLIFDREALRAPADWLCRPKYTRIVAEWLSQLFNNIARTLTSSQALLPTGARLTKCM